MTKKNHIEVWNRCLALLKDNINAVAFKTWFEPIVPVKLENNVLTIQVPSQFFYEFIEEKYIHILSKILKKELGEDAKLEYNIVMYKNSQPYVVKMPTQNKVDIHNQEVRYPLDISEKNIPNPFLIPGIKKINIDPQINPAYTFENFIEGDCNRLARAAGYAVATNPGSTHFNPLFIYSANGLGKSHLCQAIGIETKRRHPDKIVLYVPSHKFYTQYVDAVKNNKFTDFVQFYQIIDVLIIDDVHDLAGKDKTQEILFQIFNYLHQFNKQLVFTADRPPAELSGFEPRILSRFKWGLAADLQIPDYETRLAILKRKVYNDGIDIQDEVLEYIAAHITTNVRELEGALISLLAQSTLNRKAITLDLAKSIVDKIVKNTKYEMSIDFIQKVVCEYFDITPEMLKQKTRKHEIVQARQIIMFFARMYTKKSLSVIGSIVGGKDHATVLHACKAIKNLMETNKKFKQQIEEIERKLKL
ncbi:MAG: chromosomal replication initiator protein DnaA [Bacteroidales bacterium]|nr:chromosomal replication initiator protein DnaA [Bacteroidales bacterium]